MLSALHFWLGLVDVVLASYVLTAWQPWLDPPPTTGLRTLNPPTSWRQLR